MRTDSVRRDIEFVREAAGTPLLRGETALVVLSLLATLETLLTERDRDATRIRAKGPDQAGARRPARARDVV